MAEELLLAFRYQDRDGKHELSMLRTGGTRSQGLAHLKQAAAEQGWTDIHVWDYDSKADHMERHNETMALRGDSPVYSVEDIADARKPKDADAPGVEIIDHADDEPTFVDESPKPA